MSKHKSLSYRDAGVDIDAGNALVERIKPHVRSTLRQGTLGGIGGFGGLFQLDTGRYEAPVLVAGTDGVGTKLKLAIELGQLDSVGIDLVAMCANDVVVQGAEPLFFLDYFATAQLDVDAAEAVVAGIAAGCRDAGMVLLGGETAEMPGMYASGDFDLAGFCVGVVDRQRIIDGSRIEPGDCVLGLASSGVHSNGFSLVRRVVEQAGAALDDPFEASTLGDTLITPTRIYVRSILALRAAADVRGVAHITGGGLAENLERVLPSQCDARLSSDAWTRPPIFEWLQREGGIAEDDMRRTFNMGIGMVVVVPEDDRPLAAEALRDAGENVLELGRISAGHGRVFFDD